MNGVTVFRSVNSVISHTTLGCSALDAMRDAGRDPARYLHPHSAASLAEVFGPYAEARTLACRVCAVGPLLEEVLPALLAAPGEPVLVVTGLRSPEPHGGRWDPVNKALADRRRHVRTSPQERAERVAAAAERATRVAQATGMSFALSAHGPVLFGFMSADAAERLAWFVEVDTLPADGPVHPEQVTAYWSLRRTTDMDPQTAWMVAAGVTA